MQKIKKAMSHPLLNVLRPLRKTLRDMRDAEFHQEMGKEAFQILKTFETHGIKLLEFDKKRCDEYAIDILGGKHFAPWLYVFTLLSGEFKEGWIPDNYYQTVVVPRVKGDYKNLSSLKSLHSAIFQSDLFPDKLSYTNGIFFDTKYNFLPKEDVANFLFRDQEKVIFKLDMSSEGRGIYFFRRDDLSLKFVESLGNGIFQDCIKQCDLFCKFSGKSVATLRITTVYRDNGEVSVRGSYLRFGSKNDTHVQSKSQIRLPIDIQNGAFNDFAYDQGFSLLRSHPTSEIKFAGHFVPKFKECCETVIALHKQFPQCISIGWDITLDHEEKIKIMEWNGGHNSIKFHEATQGPCFSDLGWDKLNKK